jgi:hypothetical protein
MNFTVLGMKFRCKDRIILNVEMHYVMIWTDSFNFISILPAGGSAGITECELEELLSLDGEVQKELFHNQPSTSARRVPPLLLARLLSDIQPYLGEK